MTLDDLPEFPNISPGVRKGRCVLDGYRRGWGLQFGDLRDKVLQDPVYQRASQLAAGRTIQGEPCQMNLFLLLKFYLPLLQGARSIIEFGSYRGGSAIFMAAVCRELGLSFKVYGLDTFTGMPATNPALDAHSSGEFGNVGFEELVGFVQQQSISNLHFVRGLFEETAPDLLPRIAPIALAHIDCDIHSAVAASYEMVKPYMAPGGYLIFDDCAVSSCLGATEAVEDLVVRRDGMNAEQVWPHWLFRSHL